MRELRHRSVLELGLALVTAGVVVLLFVVYELVGTNLSEEHSQARLAREFNAVVSQVPATAPPAKPQGPSKALGPTSTVKGHSKAKGPARAHPARAHPVAHPTKARPGPDHVPGRGPDGATLPLPPPGGALDHMVIPAIGVDRYIVQGIDEDDLQMGPGTIQAPPCLASEATWASPGTGPLLAPRSSASTSSCLVTWSI